MAHYTVVIVNEEKISAEVRDMIARNYTYLASLRTDEDYKKATEAIEKIQQEWVHDNIPF